MKIFLKLVFDDDNFIRYLSKFFHRCSINFSNSRKIDVSEAQRSAATFWNDTCATTMAPSTRFMKTRFRSSSSATIYSFMAIWMRKRVEEIRPSHLFFRAFRSAPIPLLLSPFDPLLFSLHFTLSNSRPALSRK